MKKMFYPILLFVFINMLLNFYIGWRGWQAFGGLSLFDRRIYWGILFLFSFSYIFGRFGERFLPAVVSNAFVYIGAYWMAAMVYLLLSLLAIEALRLALEVTGNLEGLRTLYPNLPFTLGVSIVLMVAALLIYGRWNAMHPVIRHLQLEVEKHRGVLKQLHIVTVSDIHLGVINDRRKLETMVDRINTLKPDLVLIPGDIVDEDVGKVIEQNMAEGFKRLVTKYGIFACMGNHEYFSPHIHLTLQYFKESGIQLLRDSLTLIDGSFYIVGRDDRIVERMEGRKRRTLKELMQHVDHSITVLLMDHQPSYLQEAVQAGVDLQLSGHTHRGQFFPIQFITGRIFELDWGYKKKGRTHIVVSSGYGTWGPPVRIGNHPEIVDIVIKFK